MSVRIAEYAGFCSGVKKAVEAALKESARCGRVSTLGPLVHNEAVLSYLDRHRIAAVSEPEEAEGGALLIRAHGVPPAVMERARRREGLTVLDLTCPKVRRVQKLARELAEGAFRIIIFGDARHPEVQGIIGWAGEKARVDVVATADELKGIVIKPPAALIAQTTGERAAYEEIKALFLQLCPGGKVYDTLCPETGMRQAAAHKLASEVEAMIVVGSRTSANTRALAEVCRRLKPTILVAGAGELDPNFLRKYCRIGVTAGASTPHWMIKEVVERMENEKLEKGAGFAEAGPEETGEETGELETATEKEELTAEPAEMSNEAAPEEANPAAAEQEEAGQTEAATPADSAEAEPPAEEAAPMAAAEEAAERTADPAETDAAEEKETAAEDSAVAEKAGTEDEPAEPPVPAADATTAAREEEDGAAFEGEAFDFMESLTLVQVGEQVTGTVVRAAEDEVFLDIGYKSEALLPAKEVYLQEGESLVDRFVPGQEVEVTVIDMDDQESKVLVSHKRLAREKRWQELARLLEEGATEERRVRQVVNAGMVIDLGDGIDGFMPGSLVDLRYVPDFKPFLGETVRFKVIELHREKDKVILSRKKVIEEDRLRKKEETLQSLEIGSNIPGVVRRLTDFGAFVDVGGIDGLVHVSEISWERVNHPQEALKVGQEIEVQVLDVIPEKERISLSLRRTQPDPWTRAMQELNSGDVIKGKITRLVNFGAFVELRPGVEGLVHISQIADYHVKHPSEVLHEGEEVDVKILELKPQAKRIGLSIKEVRKVSYDAGQGEAANGDAGNVTLGDVFGNLFEPEPESDSGGGEAGEPDLPEDGAKENEEA